MCLCKPSGWGNPPLRIKRWIQSQMYKVHSNNRHLHNTKTIKQGSSSALLFVNVCVPMCHLHSDTHWRWQRSDGLACCFERENAALSCCSLLWLGCNALISTLPLSTQPERSERRPAVSEGTCLHPSSGTPQWALEAKWGVSLLKGGLSADFEPVEGLCCVSQVLLMLVRSKWSDITFS